MIIKFTNENDTDEILSVSLLWNSPENTKDQLEKKLG